MSDTEAGGRANPIRVLMVEDDRDDYFLVSELFAEMEGQKYALEWASNYEAGLEALLRGAHDVYLLDYRLGARNGLELLGEARAEGWMGPVILLTGQGEREVDLAAMQAGAADYMDKERLNASMLERSIRYALIHKAHADELEQKVRERTRELERANAALRASEERYRLVVEGASGFAIMMLDKQGHVATWNIGAERLLGYTEADVVGRHFERFFTPEDRAAGRPELELKKARENEKQLGDDDNWLVRKDGSRFWASGATTPLLDEAGNLRGYAKIVRDLTDRKLAEDREREEARNKDEFLAMLAHELRNPLAPIRNALRLARLEATALVGLGRDVVEVMERQLEILVRLVDDLMDVSRITRGKIHLQKEAVELKAVVARAVESSRPLIDARRHALEIALPKEDVWLEADPPRLVQVLLNLLNNAAKYTPPGGRIELAAEMERGDAGPPMVAVRVKDTGMGIAPETLPKIFDLFTQAARTIDRSDGGLGIGLTLVRRLTEMHGGSIRAYSAGHGQGSEFVLRLPVLSKRPDAAPAAPPRAGAARRLAHGAIAGGGAPRKVLVVDDNRDSAEMLAMFLRMVGHDARTAHDGQQALEGALSYRPEAVVLDIGLPGMDGLEVCRRLRDHEELRNALVIAMTGYGQEEDRQRSRMAGFNAHLVKPIDLDELQELIVAWAGAGDDEARPVGDGAA